jgi:membrane-bound serine protease (ClpP class)
MRANQIFFRISMIFTALLVALPMLLSAQEKKIAATDGSSASQPIKSEPIKIDKLILDDTIQPVSAGLLDRALTQANSDGASALLIELDTPGGLISSMRSMAGAILASRIPVIVYVTPAGARAGSAGFFLLEASDVAVMAPGTNAGAAHPVPTTDKPDDVMSQKIINDTAAFLRSYVSRRNRNSEAAEATVKVSHSYTAEEALASHLIDFTASSETQLLTALDNRAITRLDGSTVTLHTGNAQIVPIIPTLRERILGWLADPNIAILLLVCGALLIYLEFNSPGTIVPGALGTVLVLLAIFAFDLLPIHYTAVLLVVAGFALMILEAKFGGHGALAIAGILSLGFGLLTLVDTPTPELRISPAVAFSVSAAFGLITVFLLRLAWRARQRKVRLGADSVLGELATTMETLNPTGHILVDGEIWLATSSEPIPAGARVRVLSNEQNTLRVVPFVVTPPGTPHPPNSPVKTAGN